MSDEIAAFRDRMDKINRVAEYFLSDGLRGQVDVLILGRLINQPDDATALVVCGSGTELEHHLSLVFNFLSAHLKTPGAITNGDSGIVAEFVLAVIELLTRVGVTPNNN